MVWGMIMPNGLLTIKIIGKNFKSEDYIDLLKTFAVPIIKLNYESITLVQDNCRVHVARKVMEYCNKERIKVIQWPSKSPDINLIENVWKMVSDKIYSDVQPKNLKELEGILFKAVKQINEEKRQTIQHLYSSYRERLTRILISGGKILNDV